MRRTTRRMSTRRTRTSRTRRRIATMTRMMTRRRVGLANARG